jgi:hypothetical protein
VIVTDQPGLCLVLWALQPPLGQRRALFLSGMYGSELTEVIAAYRCGRSALACVVEYVPYPLRSAASWGRTCRDFCRCCLLQVLRDCSMLCQLYQ